MSPLVLTALLLCGYMCLAFVVATIRHDNGTADIAYGGGFIVAALASLYLGSANTVGLLATVLVTLWGTRLILRIGHKNFGKPEDFRYKAWRQAWGSSFLWRSFLQVYVLQGVVIAAVVSPVVLLNFAESTTLSAGAIIGTLLWCVGFYFEAVGDYQLDTFITNRANKGKLMMSGLWSYSRHPNYFGESLMWWSIALIALSTLWPIIGIGACIVFLSPLLITYLLLKVSGVPMLEAKMSAHPDFAEYQRKTSVFIPLPPRA